jgi:hypothetical protein
MMLTTAVMILTSCVARLERENKFAFKCQSEATWINHAVRPS